MKEVYRFIVGVSNLSSGGSSSSSFGSIFGSSSSSLGSSLGSSGITHACFLIDRDLFEYGANKDRLMKGIMMLVELMDMIGVQLEML